MQGTPATSQQVTQKAVQTGYQRSTFNHEVGSAVALVGIAFGVFVGFSASWIGAFAIIVTALIIGIKIQRG